MATGELAHWLA